MSKPDDELVQRGIEAEAARGRGPASADGRRKIPVSYSCTACGVVDVVVELEPRRPDETDVVKWFNSLSGVLAMHHELRKAPTCHEEKLANVKVPLTKREGGGIGEWFVEDAAGYDPTTRPKT